MESDSYKDYDYVCDKCGAVTVMRHGKNTVYRYKLCSKCDDGILNIAIPDDEIAEKKSVNAPAISYSYAHEKRVQSFRDRMEYTKSIADRIKRKPSR